MTDLLLAIRVVVVGLGMVVARVNVGGDALHGECLAGVQDGSMQG